MLDSHLPYTGGMDLLQYVSAPMCTDTWNMAVLFGKLVSFCYLPVDDIKVTPPNSGKRFDIHFLLGQGT